MIELQLPWPPSTNDFKVPHPKKRGVYYLTKRAKKFREDCIYICSRHRNHFGDKPVEMDLVLHPPTRQARDVNNFDKAVFDAIEAAKVFDNDVQVQSYRVRKGAVVKFGMVNVKIWECENVGADSRSDSQVDFIEEGVSRRRACESGDGEAPF